MNYIANKKVQLAIISISLFGILLTIFKLGQYSTNVEHISVKSFDDSSVKVLSWKPRIFYRDNFLTDDECDYIIKLGEKKVKRSMVASNNGTAVIDEYRTSHGVFFHKEKDNPLLRSIEERIAHWSQLPVENGEIFYLLRYANGQEYKPHTDWFTYQSEKDEVWFQGQGNRIATVLMYLSDVEEGGETYFPIANISVSPKKGSAILFWNLKPDGTPDNDSLHGGNIVKKGTKWCMTKWIREKKANR